MSQENVEIVVRLYDALNRYDGGDAIGLVNPGVGYDLSERVFNPALDQGHDGLRAFASELDETWSGS